MSINKFNTTLHYTVQPGDTLYQIAVNFYEDGDRWEIIAKKNSINDPNDLEVGRTIDIPPLYGSYS